MLEIRHQGPLGGAGRGIELRPPQDRQLHCGPRSRYAGPYRLSQIAAVEQDGDLGLDRRVWQLHRCRSTGGKCSEGEPGKMKLVKPSESDVAARRKVLEDFILKRWASRCSAECVKNWNETVGKLVGLKAGG